MTKKVKTEFTEKERLEIESQYLTPKKKSIDDIMLVEQKNSEYTVSTPPIEPSSINESTEPIETTIPRRSSSKHRKASLEEYRQTFLKIPKIEDRKTVFVSGEVRDCLDEIVRKLGGRKMSVSGLIENLTLHHLELYGEDIETWKRL